MVQVDVQLTRGGKEAPFIGPQGVGKAPTLTALRVIAYNHDPSAQCKSMYVSATDDSITAGGIGGTYENADPGMCTAGAPISIDNNSFDSDTQEDDTLLTNSYTTVRFFCLSPPGRSSLAALRQLVLTC